MVIGLESRFARSPALKDIQERVFRFSAWATRRLLLETNSPSSTLPLAKLYIKLIWHISWCRDNRSIGQRQTFEVRPIPTIDRKRTTRCGSCVHWRPWRRHDNDDIPKRSHFLASSQLHWQDMGRSPKDGWIWLWWANERSSRKTDRHFTSFWDVRSRVSKYNRPVLLFSII